MKQILFFALLCSLFFPSCQKDDDNISPQPKLEPRAMSITRMDILKFPAAKPSGSGWDLTTGPDIFITLSEGSTAYASDRVTTIDNNVSGGTASFTLNNPYIINDLHKYWTVGAYDSDSFDADDFISAGRFVPYDQKDGLPQSFTLGNDDFAVTFYVTWNF